MAAAACTDKDFVEGWISLGPTRLAKKLGITESTLFRRRRRLAKRGHCFEAPSDTHDVHMPAYPWRANLRVMDGVVLVASDAHYWPGPASVMHRALVMFCKEMKPKAVIFNGDVIDAVTISRYPPIGWEKRPSLADEIEVAKERLGEVEKAAFKAEKIWTLGNHDSRFETRIATVAPEYAKIHGVHLKDHFPLWEPRWETWINDDVIVRHRFKGGVHAPKNNTLYAGKSMVTGHLHSAAVVPHTDYNGTRWGVDGGCIAETDSRAFIDYTEGRSVMSWRSAFCVLTFKGGLLLQPELVLKWEEKRVQFRGDIITP